MAEDTKEINEEISDGLIPEDNEETNPEQETSTTNNYEAPQVNEATQPTPMPETPTQATNTSYESDDLDLTEEDFPVQTKQSKLQKILIVVVGILASILVIGFALYFFGFFDPDESKKTDMQADSMEMNQTKKPEKYIFDSKDINIDRLNGKLRILTKYEIIGTEEEERQKELEKNSKLSTKQINNLLSGKENKPLENEENDEERLKKLKEEEAKKAKAQSQYDLLQFIQISANNNFLSSIENETKKYNVQTSNCVDNNQQFFLIGPFNSNKELNQAYRTIYANISQGATKKDLARLEFNRICK